MACVRHGPDVSGLDDSTGLASMRTPRLRGSSRKRGGVSRTTTDSRRRGSHSPGARPPVPCRAGSAPSHFVTLATTAHAADINVDFDNGGAKVILVDDNAVSADWQSLVCSAA